MPKPAALRQPKPNAERFGGLEITWLGHSTFLFKSPKGQVVLVDPWVMGNPVCPPSHRNLPKIDLMLITHGHFDHIGDAVALAKQHACPVVAIFETCLWLESKGVTDTKPMNKGGTQAFGGIRATMVHADHSCGILDDGKVVYGGEAVGYLIEFENGVKVYHAGDTNVFGDMKLIGELYRPDVACLPIGDLYTMSPKEAAVAVRLVGAATVIPMHHGTFPALTGRPEALKALVMDSASEVLDPKPGEALR